MRQSFYTDLTDDQWAHLRAEVFDIPSPDLREVVNAVLYREMSRCPWRLLPPCFSPHQRVAEAAARWGADGTWARIRRVIEEHPPDRHPAGDSPLHRVRRAAARLARVLPGGQFLRALGRPLLRLRPAVRWLTRARRWTARTARRVPGGGLLLWPGRAMIQLAERASYLLTIQARLPVWFRRGTRHFFVEEYEDAIRYFTRVIEVQPTHPMALLRRSYSYRRLGLFREACADCWAALAAPEATIEDIYLAHYYLSENRGLLGETEVAVEHGCLARLVQRRGRHLTWDSLDEWDEAGLTPGPDEFEVLVETHNDLAELLINTQTDFETAAKLYRDGAGYRDRYARWLENIPTRTLFLGEDWVRNIGHLALIDFWVKLDRLGWRTWERKLLLAPPGMTANPAYVDYYERFFQVIRTPVVPAGIRHLANTFGPRVASLLHLPDGSCRYFPEGMGLIQEAWERAGNGPLLRLTAADEAYGRARLRAMGVPDGAWFVCLHVRSGGFHREGRFAHQSHRNADIGTYLAAAKEVVRRGGWVIRLGDPSMDPLPRLPGVIDYARGKHKSPRMDVFLCAACRFFIGVASGISHVPTTFGVPCVLTNWLSNALPVYSRHDLFLPKLLRSTRDGRLIPFDRYLDPEVRLLSYSGMNLEKAELEPVPNTPDELRDAVAEMIDRLDGDRATDPAVAGFEALARESGLVGFPRIGRAFVSKYRALLPDAPAPRLRQSA